MIWALSSLITCAGTALSMADIRDSALAPTTRFYMHGEHAADVTGEAVIVRLQAF
jgi:hypothetical protein